MTPPHALSRRPQDPLSPSDVLRRAKEIRDRPRDGLLNLQTLLVLAKRELEADWGIFYVAEKHLQRAHWDIDHAIELAEAKE